MNVLLYPLIDNLPLNVPEKKFDEKWNENIESNKNVLNLF